MTGRFPLRIRIRGSTVAFLGVQPTTDPERYVVPMTEALKISSHDELIAFIPHTLGFKPVESMVCIAIGGGPSARLDLPASRDELEPWLKTLTDVYLHTHHPARVALVAFGEDGPPHGRSARRPGWPAPECRTRAST